jgi:trigger factor
MKVSVKKAGACRKTVAIEVPAEVMAEERAETLNVYAKHARIPGFRKGKAPAHVVAGKYVKEIDQDLKERVLPKFYQEAIQTEKLKVVNVIDATEVTLSEGTPATFTVTVDVVPEFKLPKYQQIPVKVEKKEVTDAQVQEQIDQLLNQQATFDDVEDKTIEKGDMGQLSYEAFIGDQLLKEAIPEAKGIGSGTGYWVSADEHAFIPGMGEALIGLREGDSKEVDIHFPDSFMVKELADVNARYQINVTGVRVKKPAVLDEAMLERLQVESEDKLRELMRDQLEMQAENESLQKTHEQIIAFLIKKTKLDVPESAVQQQTRDVMYDLARQRMMQGASQEQIGEQQEELFKEAQERSLENVKLRYIGLAIADEQLFEASENEVEDEIARIAIQQRKDATELRKEMIENQTYGSIIDQLRFNKALNFMVETAKLK